MNAQLNFPIIAPNQAAAPAEQKLTFAEIVRAQYAAEEPVMKALAAKYKGVAFDCSTTKGLDSAKAARLELREQGRFKLQRAAEATKTEANDLKRVIDAESARLIAIIKPVEDEVDSQIKAEEERKAAEKAERERLAAELKAHHDGKIATIRACADRARGLPSDRIANGITQVEALTFGEDCGDFLAQYEVAKTETLAAMRTLLDEAKAREAAEALRLENERMAAELAAQREALEKQAAELLAQRTAATHAIVFAFPEPEPVPASTVAAAPVSLVAANNAARAEIAAATEPATPTKGEAVSPEVSSAMSFLSEVAGLRTPKPDSEPPVPAPPAPHAASATVATPATRITLGQLNERLAPIAVTAAGLAELGFDYMQEKASKLYFEADMPLICDALIAHLEEAKVGKCVKAA